MPLGDDKHKLIYEELVNVLGPDNVSDDPAVMEAFSRDIFEAIMPKERAEFIVLPGSTEDVQQIIRLANRYKFPFSVTSTGLYLSTCRAIKPYWCIIDPKRMNHFEIDEKNMYVIVEPYVTHAQVQAEALKRGLYNCCPGSSMHGSVLANNIWGNVHWTSWRSGAEARNILGIEWILPTGEVLRTGSLAIPGGGYCWGEGPGPDARGILKGIQPSHGALGVITRIAVKLFPWPGPRVFPTEGVQPEKKSILPPERFKSYFINYPTLEKALEALRELGKAEIGAWVLKLTDYDINSWTAKSREEFWSNWEYWEKNVEQMLLIGLWGYASEKQVEYEEKVLREIVKDTGGKFVPDEVHQRLDSHFTPDIVRDTYRIRFLRMGGLALFTLEIDSVEDILRSAAAARELQRKYCPPATPIPHPCKVWPCEFDRYCFTEYEALAERGEELEQLYKKGILPDSVKLAVEDSVLPYAVTTTLPVNEFGSAFANIHLLIGKIKKGLDPNNVANPTRLIDMEAMEEVES